MRKTSHSDDQQMAALMLRLSEYLEGAVIAVVYVDTTGMVHVAAPSTLGPFLGALADGVQALVEGLET